MTRTHEGIHRVDLVPDCAAERDLFIEACVTPEFARVRWAHPAGWSESTASLVCTSARQLRIMRDLFDTLATRMEALEAAQLAVTEAPDSPPGA